MLTHEKHAGRDLGSGQNLDPKAVRQQCYQPAPQVDLGIRSSIFIQLVHRNRFVGLLLLMLNMTNQTYKIEQFWEN